MNITSLYKDKVLGINEFKSVVTFFRKTIVKNNILLKWSGIGPAHKLRMNFFVDVSLRNLKETVSKCAGMVKNKLKYTYKPNF